jgi:hypothetical protein
MRRKSEIIRHGASDTDKHRPSYYAMTTSSESRWGVRHYDSETKVDMPSISEYHRAAPPRRHAGRVTGGAAQAVCSTAPNWPASEADRTLWRRPATPQMVHSFMYDHSPFNISHPKMEAGHCRPRSYLSAGLIAAQRINAAVSQLKEKQVGRGQDESQDEPAEPP